MAETETMQELVERAQAGDRQAFDRLVLRFRERFGKRLENQVRARLGAKLQAVLEVEDVLQEVFLRAFQGITRFEWRDEELLYRWFGSIAEHFLWNVSQKKVPAPLEIVRQPAASGASPSKDLRRHERFDRLEKALEGLTPAQREAVILARIRGLKVKEIARRMKRSPDAVTNLLARALLSLKRSFGDTESLHLPDRALDCEEDRHER